ncbi:MAG: DUF2442 domain-containing protein [Oscillospiraceae bacterium]|nr:DUF2442 domain-containing protein [Oscillospiraceae bacterium]
MYIINGVAYAGELTAGIEVEKVEALDDMILLLTFSTGEKRLYDTTELLEYPAFKTLENEEIYKSARVEHGVVVWLDGSIDIAPETLYANSFVYQEAGELI